MPNPIKPPFNEETAKLKVKMAQDAWNTCNPELVAKLILYILDGATVQSSLLGGKLSYSFLSANGPRNLITIS